MNVLSNHLFSNHPVIFLFLLFLLLLLVFLLDMRLPD